jgi:LysR family nitrogen assimilation transcriptional regulator
MGAEERITLKQIRYFVAVYESHSLSRAAAHVNVSQPALGTQIKALEQNLGVELFERSPSGLLPKLAAHTFAKSAQLILENLKDARLEIDRLSSAAPIGLRLGVTTTSGRELAGSLLRDAHRPGARGRYNLTLLEGRSDELLGLLGNRKIDAALSYEASPETRCEAVPLYLEEFVLVGAPSVMKGLSGAVPLDDIEGLPLVASPADQGSRPFLKRMAEERGARLNIDVEVSSATIKAEMLLHHQKCMIVPKGRFLSEIKQGKLAVVRFAPPLTRTMTLFMASGIVLHARKFLRRAVLNAVNERMKQVQLGWSTIEDQAKTSKGRLSADKKTLPAIASSQKPSS